MTRVLGLALLSSVAGCELEHESACTSGTQAVTIGRVEAEFEPLGDGAELVLVHGPQGGYHTDLDLELRGLGSGPRLELFGEIDGTRLAEDFVTIDGICVDDRVILTDLRLVWAAEPEQLDGATAWIQVRATDAAGRTAAAEVTVVIVDPA